MSPAQTVPKRNQSRLRKFAVVAGVFLFVVAVAAYVLWTRVSALMVLRWFVQETGIPAEVTAASWDVRINELLAGKIRDLRLELHYNPLNVDVELHTPVNYSNSKGHWSITLAPEIRVGRLPPAFGSIVVELDVKREGSRARAEAALIEYHLHETKPLHLTHERLSFSAESWSVHGRFHLNPLQTDKAERLRAGLTVLANNVKFKTGDTRSLAFKWVKLENMFHWPEAPPLPIHIKSNVQTGPLQLLADPLFIEEAELLLNAELDFNGHRSENVDISVDKPLPIGIHGAIGEGGSKAAIVFRAPLEEIIDKRLAQWLEGEAPLLRRAKAKGTLDFNGHAAISETGNLSAKGHVKINAERVEFPSRNLYVDQAKIALPLSFPELPDWGTVTIGTADFHSVKLKNLSLYARVSKEGVDATTENEDGSDSPIRQMVWGGAIDIANLYAHFAGKQGFEFTAAVTGGPFKLEDVQRDLCLMHSHPLKGLVSFTYPKIVQDHDSFRLIGDTNLTVFNGTAHVGDMHLLFGEKNPRLRFDFEWNDLDMQAIGEWTRLGDIRGSLNGSLKKAEFALTPYGPVPLAYDFTLQGLGRGGNKLSFYGRALNNVVELITGQPLGEESLPIKALFGFTSLFRNWVPAKGEVMGMHAKADGDWTELTTFDPPEDADTDWCEPKNHYLLCGHGFRIPLNTHGVYPVLMKTDAFQGWLSGFAQYLKGRIKNDKKYVESECTPPW